MASAREALTLRLDVDLLTVLDEAADELGRDVLHSLRGTPGRQDAARLLVGAAASAWRSGGLDALRALARGVAPDEAPTAASPKAQPVPVVEGADDAPAPRAASRSPTAGRLPAEDRRAADEGPPEDERRMGELLKAWRDRHSVSQPRAARLLGVGQSTVSGWESSARDGRPRSMSAESRAKVDALIAAPPSSEG